SPRPACVEVVRTVEDERARCGIAGIEVSGVRAAAEQLEGLGQAGLEQEDRAVVVDRRIDFGIRAAGGVDRRAGLVVERAAAIRQDRRTALKVEDSAALVVELRPAVDRQRV